MSKYSLSHKSSQKPSVSGFTKQEHDDLQAFFKEITKEGIETKSLDALHSKLDGVKIPESLKLRVVRSFYWASGSNKCLTFDNFIKNISILCKDN